MRRADFVEQCERRLGFCLAAYRDTAIERALARAMKTLDCSRLDELLTILEDDPHRRQAFVDDLAVNVTTFFRDPKPFRHLKRTILPALLRRRGSVRVWSAGCATGQEAYSLAMLLEEIDLQWKSRVVATDIDGTALAKARRGLYDKKETAGLSAVRRRAFFVRRGRQYQVGNAISDRVTFRRHDLLRGRFPINYYDLIAFRNVAIHFERGMDRALHVRFVEALRSGGVLFLGGAESLFSPEGLGLARVGPCCYVKQKSEREPDTAGVDWRIRESA